MPDYKKKKVGKIKHRHYKGEKDIPMKGSGKGKEEVSGTSVRVVKGKKLENRRKLRIFAATAAVLAVTIAVLSFVLPVGLLENITNITAVMGVGKYPYELYGTEVLNTVSRGNYYYVLTDTSLIASSNNGKIIYNHSHGFSRPVLSVSETRALIFDQGGSVVDVYNLKEEICSVKIDGTIITAYICRSGSFAVAYENDEYTASVAVFNKNGKRIYLWNSAKELINNVALAPSGKKLAVSTLSAETGRYVSTVSVLGFDSADPLYKKKLDDDTVLKLDGAFSRGFSVLSGKHYSFIGWSDFKEKEISSDFEPAMYRHSKGNAVLVHNRAGDRSDNRITVISKKGEKISEFDFDGIISDITYAHGHIYCISDTKVYMLDKDGKLMRSGECGYGFVRLAVTGTYSLAVMSGSETKSIELEK